MIGGVLLVGALGLVPQALPLHRPFHTPASPILLRQPESTESVAPEPRAESPREAAASNAVTEKDAPWLLTYFAFGCVAYSWLEGWSPVDSVYFLTVVATTVGYGDITPTTDAGKLFTAVYALIGVTTVFKTLTDVFRQNPLSTSDSSWQDSVLTAVDNLYARRAFLSDDADMSCDVVTLDELRARVNWPRRFLSCLLGPLLLFTIGIGIGVGVEGFDVINSAYWSAITMTTIGLGDASPHSVTGKLLAVFYLPVAVLVLADAVKAASRVAVQRQILESPYETRSEALLLQEAARTGRVDETLTEAEFLISVLTDYSLVDAETINSIRQQFKYVVRYAESGAVDGTPPERGSAVYSSGRAILLTNELVFREAVQRGEVPQGVDLEAADGGYKEWYEQHWAPRVREAANLRSRSRRGGDTAEQSRES